MRGQNALFSSVKNNSPNAKDDWETPDSLFHTLHNEFRFTLDACASSQNAKVDTYFTEHDNGLAQEWKDHTVWINPPYSSAKDWIQKAIDQYNAYGITVVMLLPSRTGNSEWHNLIQVHAAQVRFLRGRLKFKGSSNSAPFDSAVIIFSKDHYDQKYIFIKY